MGGRASQKHHDFLFLNSFLHGETDLASVLKITSFTMNTSPLRRCNSLGGWCQTGFTPLCILYRRMASHQVSIISSIVLAAFSFSAWSFVWYGWGYEFRIEQLLEMTQLLLDTIPLFWEWSLLEASKIRRLSWHRIDTERRAWVHRYCSWFDGSVLAFVISSSGWGTPSTKGWVPPCLLSLRGIGNT